MQKTIILYLFLSDYHSGQKSRGYRILSAVQRRLRRHKTNINDFVKLSTQRSDIRQDYTYHLLYLKFADKV